MVSDYQYIMIEFIREIKRIVMRRAKIEIKESEREKGDKNERAKTLEPKWEWIWDI